MLRLGQSTVRVTRGVDATSRSHALLPSSGLQQHGMSMLRSLGAAGHGPGNTSSTGGSTGLQDAVGVSSGSNSVRVLRKISPAFSAAHLSTPKRLMSTAVGGGDPPTGDTAAANAAAAADLGPDAVAGAADAAMAAAGAADKVRYGGSRCYLYAVCLVLWQCDFLLLLSSRGACFAGDEQHRVIHVIFYVFTHVLVLTTVPELQEEFVLRGGLAYRCQC